MMKDLKPALWILLRFVLIYFVLFIAYEWYLRESQVKGLDTYSRWVAQQVNIVQSTLGYSSFTIHYPNDLAEVFFISNQSITRMVEGCNSVSVMILCLAFVFSFYQGTKTWFFALGSIIFLHIINVLRIVGINLIYVEKKDLSGAAHDYLFPAVIYGSVVLIWVLWMRIIRSEIR